MFSSDTNNQHRIFLYQVVRINSILLHSFMKQEPYYNCSHMSLLNVLLIKVRWLSSYAYLHDTVNKHQIQLIVLCLQASIQWYNLQLDHKLHVLISLWIYDLQLTRIKIRWSHTEAGWKMDQVANCTTIYRLLIIESVIGNSYFWMM